MIKQKILATTLLTGLLAAGSAQAAVLASYELTGGSENVTDADGADFITFSTLNFNSFSQSDVTNAGAQDFIQVNGTEDAGTSNNLNTSLGQAIAANSYFSFTVTNNSGLALQLDSFSVDTAYTNTFRAGYGLYSSADGFDSTAGDRIGAGTSTPATTATQASFTRVTDLITLSGAGANVATSDFLIADGGSLTFFLVGVQNSSSDTRIWEFDNISVSGTAVPEPSSAALLGLGGLALILRRRK